MWENTPTFQPRCTSLLQGDDITYWEMSFLWPYITSFTVTRVCGIHGRSISGCPIGPAFCLLEVANQHPGSPSPVSLLRCSSTGVMMMWMGSLSNSSLGCLTMSTTVVSSHFMACWSFHACSATADFSRVPFLQASWCSLNLVSNLLLVSPM